MKLAWFGDGDGQGSLTTNWLFSYKAHAQKKTSTIGKMVSEKFFSEILNLLPWKH
jgi:hypothetical protein